MTGIIAKIKDTSIYYPSILIEQELVRIACVIANKNIILHSNSILIE